MKLMKRYNSFFLNLTREQTEPTHKIFVFADERRCLFLIPQPPWAFKLLKILAAICGTAFLAVTAAVFDVSDEFNMLFSPSLTMNSSPFLSSLKLRHHQLRQVSGAA